MTDFDQVLETEPVLIPVAIGELADKITILAIKVERITDTLKLQNVRMELELLRTIWERLGTPSPVLIGLVRELKETNVSLLVIEDKIRECERRQEFGSRFIELARAVYQNNDRRS